MDYIKLEMDEKGLELVFLYQNIFFLAEILFAKHTLSDVIILNEASLGGSPTISGTLHPPNQQRIQNHQHFHQN